MIKVLVAALLGTVVGIAVMVIVIVAAGSSTSNASSVGLNPTVSTAAVSTPASSPSSTPSSTPSSGGGSSSGGGNAAAIADGKQVFSSNGCGSCHTLTVAGASGTIGPDLGKAVAGDAQKDNMPVADFIKQSITDPGAYTASGGPWATPMPTTFGSSLSATQIDDLVALIISGQGK
jgi:cytochrome c551/c552